MAEDRGISTQAPMPSGASLERLREETPEQFSSRRYNEAQEILTDASALLHAMKSSGIIIGKTDTCRLRAVIQAALGI